MKLNNIILWLNGTTSPFHLGCVFSQVFLKRSSVSKVRSYTDPTRLCRSQGQNDTVAHLHTEFVPSRFCVCPIIVEV
jgi:hypothetical protein